MISTKLWREYRTQIEHGMYCTPPGPAVCAIQRARALLAFEARGGEFVWEDDPESIGYEEPGDYYVASAVLDGETVYSIGGVHFLPNQFDRGYARTIEAEMALEVRP